MNPSEISNTKIDLGLPDSRILYYPNFLPSDTATKYFERLEKDLVWSQEEIKIFGRTILQPRLTALYAINDTPYTYSHLTLHPHRFTAEIMQIHQHLILLTQTEFTHCLANLYRDGNDSMGWHSDNEKELGIDPVMASVSLGAERKFQFKHKLRKGLKYNLQLQHGSLLLMEGNTQHYWKHQLPKTKNADAARINLTFRNII